MAWDDSFVYSVFFKKNQSLNNTVNSTSISNNRGVSGALRISPGAPVALNPADMRNVLEAGARVVETAVKTTVSMYAENPTGLLESSITAEYHPYAACPYAQLGWDETPIPNNRKRGYVDGRGRARKVDTVDDYARILEYSERRQLRHMEVGYDAVSDIAEKRMEEQADALLARMAKDAGL